MPLDRRGILKGIGAASIGGSAIFGSGALTQITSARTVSVDVTNDSASTLSLSAGDAVDGVGDISETDGQLSFSLSDINADSQLIIGDAPSADPTSDTISSTAFEITNNATYDDSDMATAIEVEVSGSGSASGLGLLFLPTNNTDDLANYNTTGYTPSDQDSVAGANLSAHGTDITALPGRYDTDNDSAKFLLDEESTVGAELILQADADDLDANPSFDITITAQSVDAPPELSNSNIGMNVSQINDSSTATHTLEVTNNYSEPVTSDISVSETGLSVSQTGVSIASGATTEIDIDAAHLDTITPTVDATNDTTGNTVTAQQQVSVSGPATGGTESIRVEDGGTLYDVHAFKSTGSNTLTVASAPSSGTVDALLVGGGGGGGSSYHGAGGGAGGLLFEQGISVSTQDYSISVGKGGSGGDPSKNKGANGDNTTAFGLTALGGGGGDAGNGSGGKDGGSGGGGSKGSNRGTGLQSGSTDGGSGNDGGDYVGDNYDTGGGGGAGAAGTASDGGDGLDYSDEFSSTFGEDGYFAGGGAGSTYESGSSNTGGLGGGGNGDDGADNSATIVPQSEKNGQDYTGGGGGGGERSGDNNQYSGGDGGHGIVLVRYQV